MITETFWLNAQEPFIALNCFYIQKDEMTFSLGIYKANKCSINADIDIMENKCPIIFDNPISNKILMWAKIKYMRFNFKQDECLSNTIVLYIPIYLPNQYPIPNYKFSLLSFKPFQVQFTYLTRAHLLTYSNLP